MKKLLLVLLLFSLNIGHTQQLEKYTYKIGVENVMSYVDAKPLYDPLRKVGKCTIIDFNEQSHLFVFKSSQNLSEEKFIDLFTSLGYVLQTYTQEVLTK